MGLHLSIDDFGTGYSSLSALQQFPIGTLKVDQSFVRDVDDDESDATIVRTVIEMGRSLKMNVIAEGVESLGPSEFPAPPSLRLRPGQAVRRAGDARRAAPAARPPAGDRSGIRRPDRAVREPRQDRQAARGVAYLHFGSGAASRYVSRPPGWRQQNKNNRQEDVHMHKIIVSATATLACASAFARGPEPARYRVEEVPPARLAAHALPGRLPHFRRRARASTTSGSPPETSTATRRSIPRLARPPSRVALSSGHRGSARSRCTTATRRPPARSRVRSTIAVRCSAPMSAPTTSSA